MRFKSQPDRAVAGIPLTATIRSPVSIPTSAAGPLGRTVATVNASGDCLYTLIPAREYDVLPLRRRVHRIKPDRTAPIVETKV